MGKFCSTAFSLFFTSVVLASAIGDPCQVVLMNRCRKGYQEDLIATSESVGGHCSRMQKIVTCFTSEPKCRGELIEKFRYWIVQMTMMDKILGVCKDIDYTALKSIVQESDVGKTHRFLEDFEFDTVDACALTVHKKCLRYYLTLLIKDHGQFCKDAEKLNKCYDLYSKSINCNAKIIQEYASMVEGVAHRVVEIVESHMKSLCKAEL
ncbi:uncharacterized protein LOC144658344 [Oculina patagonica]